MRRRVATVALVLFLLCGVNMPYEGVGKTYRDQPEAPRVVTLKDFLPGKAKPKPPGDGDVSPKFQLTGVYTSPVLGEHVYVHMHASRSNEGEYCVLNIYMILKQQSLVTRDIHIECRPETWETGTDGKTSACSDTSDMDFQIAPSLMTAPYRPLLIDADITSPLP